MATTFTGQPRGQVPAKVQPAKSQQSFAGAVKTYCRSLNKPDEVRNFPKGKLELVNSGDTSIGRATFQPGWKWSESVGPIAGTKSCEESHVGYCLAGHMRILMDSGEQLDIKAGDGFTLSPGHNAEVLGNEPCIMLDVKGFKNYAKPS